MGADVRLEPPSTDRAMLVRRRLLERLKGRWFVPVTVVVAPAGYGKTTLLTQAMAANQAAPAGVDCWLACGPEVAAVSSFAEGLCRAVGAPPVASDSGDDVAAVVVQAMWRQSPQQVALLLDDVHEIPAETESAKVLAAIVASLPANGHVVLAGRTPPPVALARLEVQGRVQCLGEADLAFTDEELAEFASLRQVPASRVAASSGWPALAELSASLRADVTGDYVGQEVLSRLGPDRRRALALLAHLGPFDEPLARAVLGADVDVAELIAGFPLVTVGADGKWILHSIWSSLLAKHVIPAEVAEARRRAGVELVRRGQAGAAVRLLIDAEAWDDLGRAIAEALGAAHPPVARDVLEEWFNLLPPDVQAGPTGRLLAAVAAIEGDLGGAWQEFEECAAAFRALGETTGELACLLQLGQLAWWFDQPERLVGVAARVFELEAAGWAEAVPFACLGRAMIFDIADDGRQMLHQLDRIPTGSLSESWQGIVSWARAIAYLGLGYLPEGQEAAERALTYAGSLHAPLAQGTRLQTLWYQGQLGEVLEKLPALLERISTSGFRNDTALVAAQCSTMYALRGRADQAARYLQQARAAAAAVPDAPLVDTNLTIAEASVAVAAGDEAGAAAALEAYVARHPIGVGIPAAAQRRHLTLLYVLVPATRAVWDAADLGPAWRFARDLGQALTAVRERGRFPSETPPLDEVAAVQAHLPPRWVAELGVAAIAAGRDDGWRLLDATWPLTRDAVAELAHRADPPHRRAAREVVGRLPVPPSARLRLRLLGPVELTRDGVPVQTPEWRRERVRSLLAHLALHRTVGRGQVADDLWPSLDGEAQSRNFRVTLTYLLRVLEPSRAPRDASFFVRQHGGNLSLHAGEWLEVDVWDFDNLCDQAVDADRRGAPAEALDHALGAVGLWRGEPTELLSDEWALAPFEQRRRRFTAVAIRAGELLLAQRAFDQAYALAEQALALDPWLEAAHRLVVATHRAAGDDLAARSALGRYRAAIREIGLTPDEATLMVERLLDNLPLVSEG